MRLLIDLAQSQIDDLNDIAREDRKSRVALIREAVDGYLATRRGRAASDAFGLWGDRAVDGLAFQQKARGEW
jgi:metal-responsive CopG/Arc/MetJ family transcriptional regulator